VHPHNINPDIFAFTDVRSYLKNVLEDRKQKNPGLGLRYLAKRAGFASPSTLSMMISGKRKFTDATAEKLAKALCLTGKNRRYLKAMIKCESARTDEERFEAQELMLKLRSATPEYRLSLAHYSVLATWYYPAIYVMVGMRDFRRNPSWIAARLGHEVSEQDVKRALGDLINLGLLQDKGGQLVQTQRAFTTEDDVRDLAIRRYHQSMMDLGVKSLTLPLEEREIGGLTIAIPKTDIPRLKERLREFRRELNESFSVHEATADEVFQFGFQLFPLTRKPNENGNSA
jgi:uncharacterized protein (TIGR02147 family)